MSKQHLPISVPTSSTVTIGSPVICQVPYSDALYTVLLYETVAGFEQGYRAEVPVLPGCTVDGKTKEDVEAGILHAIRAYRAAQSPQGPPPPEPPPGWKGQELAWAMVLYLIQELNEREQAYRDIENLRKTAPEEARNRRARLDQPWSGFSGTSAQMRYVAKTLFTRGAAVALEEYATWLLQEMPNTNPERGRQLAARSRWPPKVKAMLERMPPVLISLAAWTLLSDPALASRLRQCPTCSRYFFDRTRNRSKKRCSRACKDRTWNRRARRAAAGRRSARAAPSGSAFGGLIPLPKSTGPRRSPRKRTSTK